VLCLSAPDVDVDDRVRPRQQRPQPQHAPYAVREHTPSLDPRESAWELASIPPPVPWMPPRKTEPKAPSKEANWAIKKPDGESQCVVPRLRTRC
jgi:hypothetical protein